MPSKEYHVPEEHLWESLTDKIKSLFGVHSVEVERESKKMVVHVNSDEIFPGVDQVYNEFGIDPAGRL